MSWGDLVNQIEGGNLEYHQFVGRKIQLLKINNNVLSIGFKGFVLEISDRGQSCCEDRYMTCDDDLQSYCGERFLGFEIRDAPDIKDSEVHEVQFLIVNTDKGSFSIANHNVHNGYYGGFNIGIEVVNANP